jgi:hypothetical protein
MSVEHNNVSGMISVTYGTIADDEVRNHENENHDQGEVIKQDIYIIDSLMGRYFSFNDKMDNEVLCMTFLNDGTIAYLSKNMLESNSLYIVDFNAQRKEYLTQFDNVFEELYHSDENFTMYDNKKLFSSLGSYHIDNIFYDDDNNIWYYTNGTICYYSMEEDCIKTFYDLAGDIPLEFRQYPCNDIYIFSDKVIATHYISKMVYIITNSINDDITDLNRETVKILINNLQVPMNAENLKAIIKEIYGMNAEITVYNYDFNNEKFTTKLLAGDIDFDIYGLSSEFMPYYAKNGACYDLSSEKKIVEQFDYMFDGLKELCSVGSKLCGVPLFLNKLPSMWSCNVELAEKLAIDIVNLSTKKMTWEEFYDFSVIIKNKAETLNIENFSVLSYLGWEMMIDHRIDDYMTNYLDYTNKNVEDMRHEYAGYLDSYIKMLNEGLISNEDGGSALFSRLGAFDYLNYNNQIFPQPLITANDSYIINSIVLAINPNSPNIEAAKKYLEYSVALPVLKRRIGDYLLKNWDLYEYYNPITNEIIKHKAKTNGHDVTAFMIKNGKAEYYNWDIFKEMSSDIGSILEFKISSKDFAQKLYEKSKMIIEE